MFTTAIAFTAFFPSSPLFVLLSYNTSIKKPKQTPHLLMINEYFLITLKKKGKLTILSAVKTKKKQQHKERKKQTEHFLNPPNSYYLLTCCCCFFFSDEKASYVCISRKQWHHPDKCNENIQYPPTLVPLLPSPSPNPGLTFHCSLSPPWMF